MWMPSGSSKLRWCAYRGSVIRPGVHVATSWLWVKIMGTSGKLIMLARGLRVTTWRIIVTAGMTEGNMNLMAIWVQLWIIEGIVPQSINGASWVDHLLDIILDTGIRSSPRTKVRRNKASVSFGGLDNTAMAHLEWSESELIAKDQCGIDTWLKALITYWRYRSSSDLDACRWRLLPWRWTTKASPSERRSILCVISWTFCQILLVNGWEIH